MILGRSKVISSKKVRKKFLELLKGKNFLDSLLGNETRWRDEEPLNQGLNKKKTSTNKTGLVCRLPPWGMD